MADSSAEHHGAAHSDSHYVKIWGILLVLLVVSIAGPEVSGNFPPSIAKIVVLITAFGIAFVKAGLVVKHFMHLTVERPVVRYILITCLVFIGLFFAGVSPDVLRHTGTNWSNLAAADAIERGLEKQAQAAEHGDEHGEEGVAEKGDVEVMKTPAVPPEPNYAALTDPADKGAWLKTLGQSIYTRGTHEAPGSACVMCHGAEGTGVPGLAGTLVAAQSLANCAQAARITLHGATGTVEFDGGTRKAVMPGYMGLNDEQVAAVLTYMRTSWGNNQGLCEPSEIAAAR